MSQIRTVLALLALASAAHGQTDDVRKASRLETMTAGPSASGTITSITFDPDASGSYSNYAPATPAQQMASPFQLADAAIVDGISWYGRYDASLPLSSPVGFIVAFFADEGGKPTQSPVARFNVPAGVQDTVSTFRGIRWYSYSASLSLTLTPGSYWLSILENDARSPQWLWAHGKYVSGRAAYRASDGQPWTPGDAMNYAFALFGGGGGAGGLTVTTSSPVPPGTVGVPYSLQLDATGGAPPYAWRITSGTLPGGLIISTGGMISGTPAAVSACTLTVEVRDSAGGVANKTVQLLVNSPPGSGPAITAGGIVNAATNAAGPIAAGSLVSVYGANFSDAPAQADSIPLPTTLGKVSLTFNNISAPLVFVSPGQINAQVPWDVLPAGTQSGSATVVVTRDGVSSAPASVQVSPFSPGIFAVNYGAGAAIAINPDGSLAAPGGAIPGVAARPAYAGDPGGLIILATGLGALDSAQAQGTNSLDKVRKTLTTPEVLVGGMAAVVTFAGASPQFVGVNQVNVTISAAAPVGDSVPLQLRIGGITTSDRVTVAVARPADPLVVSPPDSLQVSGQSGQLDAASYRMTYTVRNATATVISYTLTNSANWVTVSKSTGTVAAGGQDTFTVSLNSNANLLNAGSYTANITLTDKLYGSTVTRSVALNLAPGPCLNIAGEWAASEKGTLTCTLTVNGESETDTDPISSGDLVTISQQGCQFSYTSTSIAAGFGSSRSVRQGQVTDSNVTITGIMGQLAAGFNYEKNVFEAVGTVQNGVIHLTGSGTLVGNGIWQGMNTRFSCSANTVATLTKVR